MIKDRKPGQGLTNEQIAQAQEEWEKATREGAINVEIDIQPGKPVRVQKEDGRLVGHGN